MTPTRWFFALAVVGWVGWLLSGSLLLALLVTGGFLFAYFLLVPPSPWRPFLRQKRWTWGGGLMIPPFFVGGWRRGDDE